MAFEVQLPHVGESVTEAVIGKWLKSAGYDRKGDV